MRSENPSTSPSVARLRLAARAGLVAGTIVAAWIAAGAPIRLGMITDMLP